MSLPPYSFKHLMSIISSRKTATLFKFVSTTDGSLSPIIGHIGFLWRLPLTTRSQTSVPRSPFPAPRFSNIPKNLADTNDNPSSLEELMEKASALFFPGWGEECLCRPPGRNEPQAAQAHYRNADVTLACERCCVTNGYSIYKDLYGI